MFLQRNIGYEGFFFFFDSGHLINFDPIIELLVFLRVKKEIKKSVSLVVKPLIYQVSFSHPEILDHDSGFYFITWEIFGNTQLFFFNIYMVLFRIFFPYFTIQSEFSINLIF